MLNLASMKSLGDSPKDSSRPRFIFQNSQHTMNRKILRQSFGNQGIHSKDEIIYPQKYPSGLTPFRKSLNAGDVFMSNNKAPWAGLSRTGSNQINLPRQSGVGDGTSTVKTEYPLFVASAYSGNPRFVYDGSDYTRYKKLAATNINYDDKTFGGNKNNASQQAYRRVTR